MAPHSPGAFLERVQRLEGARSKPPFISSLVDFVQCNGSHVLPSQRAAPPPPLHTPGGPSEAPSCFAKPGRRLPSGGQSGEPPPLRREPLTF